MSIWRGLLDVIGVALAFFFDLVPSYGIAIILLTIAVGVLLFPLTLKQTRSMRAMQEIQPEVKRLQKELKGDRERLNQELMALYRERGVNPAAGCLPLVLQAPIWFALFSVLRSPQDFVPATSGLAAAIAENAHFLSMDLKLSPSQALGVYGIVPLLPYLVLIGIVIASGYYQQKQVTGSNPEQQQMPQMQMVTKVMPLMFGVFSWTFPTGLVLYFAASNVFRIGQQSLMLWLEARPGEAGRKEAAKEKEGEESQPPREARPRPPAKRRKKRKR